jgi:hypothetical protein
MAFSRNEDIRLAHKALPLWVSLLSSAERAQRGQQGQFNLPMECAAALMDLAGGPSPNAELFHLHLASFAQFLPDSLYGEDTALSEKEQCVLLGCA